jgi:hypothetical protein
MEAMAHLVKSFEFDGVPIKNGHCPEGRAAL